MFRRFGSLSLPIFLNLLAACTSGSVDWGTGPLGEQPGADAPQAVIPQRNLWVGSGFEGTLSSIDGTTASVSGSSLNQTSDSTFRAVRRGDSVIELKDASGAIIESINANVPKSGLDFSFGRHGSVRTTLTLPFFTGLLSSGQPIDSQADGKILVSGSRIYFQDLDAGIVDYDFAISRLMPDGKTDSTFGERGTVTLHLSDYEDTALSVLVQPDGKILASGFYSQAIWGPQAAVVVRLHANGSLDTSFATNGIFYGDFGNLITPGSNYRSAAAVMKLQSDGAILVGGNVQRAPGGDFLNFPVDNLLFRLTKTGTLDTSFASVGYVTERFSSFTNPGRPSEINSILLDSENRIVVGGYTEKCVSEGVLQSKESYGIARYLPDGSLDASFGVNGKNCFKVSASNSDDRSIALIQLTDKSFLMGGMAGFGSSTGGIIHITQDGHWNRSTFALTQGLLSMGTTGTLVDKLLLQPSGDFLALGGGIFGERLSFVTRFNALGSPVTDFGKEGFFLDEATEREPNRFKGVAIQSAGEVAGRVLALAYSRIESDVALTYSLDVLALWP